MLPVASASVSKNAGPARDVVFRYIYRQSMACLYKSLLLSDIGIMVYPGIRVSKKYWNHRKF